MSERDEQDTGGPLEPCPFCGKGEACVVGTWMFTVQCQFCGAQTHLMNSREAAVNRWNERTPTSSRERALLGEMAEALRRQSTRPSEQHFANCNCIRCGNGRLASRYDAATKETDR